MSVYCSFGLLVQMILWIYFDDFSVSSARRKSSPLALFVGYFFLLINGIYVPDCESDAEFASRWLYGLYVTSVIIHYSSLLVCLLLCRLVIPMSLLLAPGGCSFVEFLCIRHSVC
jgi:hypothetical protein